MSDNNSPTSNRLRVEIVTPFGETVSLHELVQWLNRTSPRATLEVLDRSYASSSNSSVGEETTSSQEKYLRRARSHIADEAKEALLAQVADKLDQEYDSEPDKENPWNC